MRVVSVTLAILGSLWLVSGAPIPGDGDDSSAPAQGSSGDASKAPVQGTSDDPSPAPVQGSTSTEGQVKPKVNLGAWGKGPSEKVKEPPPGGKDVDNSLKAPPSSTKFKDSENNELSKGDIKKFKEGSDKTDGHPMVYVGNQQALKMTHTPLSHWKANEVKDASKYNVPGVDATTKIHMRPEKVKSDDISSWDHSGKNDHKMNPKDMEKLEQDMCGRASGASCSYKPGTKAGVMKAVQKPVSEKSLKSTSSKGGAVPGGNRAAKTSSQKPLTRGGKTAASGISSKKSSTSKGSPPSAGRNSPSVKTTSKKPLIRGGKTAPSGMSSKKSTSSKLTGRKSTFSKANSPKTGVKTATGKSTKKPASASAIKPTKKPASSARKASKPFAGGVAKKSSMKPKAAPRKVPVPKAAKVPTAKPVAAKKTASSPRKVSKPSTGGVTKKPANSAPKAAPRKAPVSVPKAAKVVTAKPVAAKKGGRK